MWDYILADQKPNRRDEFGVLYNDGFYSIPELVEQFNKINKTAFAGTNDGWLRETDLGTCHIKTLDGMCGVMIAHKLNIPNYCVPNWYPLLEFMAKKGNYTYITMSNVVGDRLTAWKKEGFETMLAFRNKRTANQVQLLIKQVPYEKLLP